MYIKYIPHQEIEREDLSEIIKIKSVAWPYPAEAQIKWIEEHLKSGDVHVFLYDDSGIVVAYLNLIEIQFTLNNHIAHGYGIGNVCALKRGNGDGGKLIVGVNEFLVRGDRIGMLFCKDVLVKYYARFDWRLIPKDRAIVSGLTEGSNIMIFNFGDAINELIYKGKLF